jgi:hypothetical protein
MPSPTFEFVRDAVETASLPRHACSRKRQDLDTRSPPAEKYNDPSREVTVKTGVYRT